MTRGWISWGGGSVHIPGNGSDGERSEPAGDLRGAGSSPGAAPGATKRFGKQTLLRSQRAEQGSFLAVQLPRRESKRYSHCLRSRVPSLVFVCVCVYFSEFLSLHPRELAGCKLWPSHGIRINSWILAAPGGDQLLLNCSLMEVPQAIRHPKKQMLCASHLSGDKKPGEVVLHREAFSIAQGPGVLLLQTLSFRLEGPMIHSPLLNLKVDSGGSLKTRAKGAVPSQTSK